MGHNIKHEEQPNGVNMPGKNAPLPNVPVGNNTPEKKNNTGLIIGIVIAVVVIGIGILLAVIIGVAAYFGIKSSKVTDNQDTETTETYIDTEAESETESSTEMKAVIDSFPGTSDTTEEQVEEQPVDDAYVIYDYKFDDGNELGFWCDNTAKGYVHVSDDAMCVTAQNFGENLWDIGMASADFTITAGKTYTVSFDAYSNYEMKIYVGLKKNYDDWAPYMENTFFAEPTWTHYEYTYAASGNDYPCNIVFFLGGTGSELYSANGDITFMVDNLKITEK